MSIGPGSASIRRRIFSMPGAVLMLEAADLAEAGDVAAGLPLAGAALVHRAHLVAPADGLSPPVVVR
jgi:hypothetical protein